MHTLNKKIMRLAFATLLAVATLAVGTIIFKTKSASASVAPVTVDQLTAAGFTGVEVVTSTASRYLPPVYYFRVKQDVLPQNGWGDASNLVAVLIRPKINPDWQYNNGQIEVRDLAGRTQARVTSANNYIVVTGPDQQKVAILAHDLLVSN